MIFFIIFSLTKHPLKSTLSAAKRKKRKLHGMQCKTTANEFDTISCKKVMQKVLDPQMNYIRSQQTTTDDMHTNSHGLQYNKVKALIKEHSQERDPWSQLSSIHCNNNFQTLFILHPLYTWLNILF